MQHNVRNGRNDRFYFCVLAVAFAAFVAYVAYIALDEVVDTPLVVTLLLCSGVQSVGRINVLH